MINNFKHINKIFIVLFSFITIACSPESKFDNIDEVELFFNEAKGYYWDCDDDFFKSYSSVIDDFETIRYVTAPNRKFEDEELYNKAAIKEIRCYEKDDDDKAALSLSKEWINTYPNKKSYEKLGKIYSWKFSQNKAINLYEKGINEGVNLYSVLATLYLEKKDYGKAIENFNLAIKKGDKKHSELANAYKENEQYTEAGYVLKTAIKEMPEKANEYASQLIRIAEHVYYNKNYKLAHELLNAYGMENEIAEKFLLKTIYIANQEGKYYHQKYALKKLIDIAPQTVSYRNKIIDFFIAEEMFTYAEQEINNAEYAISSFNKQKALDKLNTKIINTKYSDNDFSIYNMFNKKQETLIGQIFQDIVKGVNGGAEIKIENNSMFKLKNINIILNNHNIINVYYYQKSYLYANDYTNINYKFFTKENGEKFDAEKWEIKKIKITFDVTYKGASVEKSYNYSF